MSSEQTIQRYFIENRSRLLDIAAYLDRIDRSQKSANPCTQPSSAESQSFIEQDFRIKAFREAIEILLSHKSNRVEGIQTIFSDLTLEPKESREEISAFGAFKNGNPDCC